MDFKIKLNEGLYNSGVLGFYRILKANDIPFSIVDSDGNENDYGDTIKFSSDIFENFTDCYMKTVINQLGEDAAFHKLESIRNKLKGFDFSSENAGEDLKKMITTVKDKMKSNSYKAAYQIIKEKGEDFDFLNAFEEIKKINFKESYDTDIITQSLGKMIEYKDVFLLKDIMYTNITKFWSGVAFLNQQKNTYDISKAYSEYFVKPIEDYVSYSDSDKKKKYSCECCHCGLQLTNSQSRPMSWISNMGVDLKRKTSPFWNFNADLVLCPICSMIYSCVPLGFTTKGTESYFVNLNSSIYSLRISNNFEFDEDKKLNYYQIIRKFIDNENQEVAKNEIDNIQVIRRSGDSLYQNILSKDKLSDMKKCSSELQSILKKNYTINNNWYNLFDEVINCIFGYSNMYRLLNEQLLISINDGRAIFTSFINNRHYNHVTALESIQVKLFNEGDVIMNSELMDSGFKAGWRMRIDMLGPEKNENKIKGLSFRLVNALKCRNTNQFLDTVMRQYLSSKNNMPKELTTAMDSEEHFLCYGYAFLNGLNSYTKKDSENKEVITNE